jgi:predicted metal-dependent hydrolase
MEKNLKAKRISISIKPVKGIRVSIPNRESFERAQEFVYQKADWIRTHTNKVQKHEEKITVYDHSRTFRTRYHTLSLEHHIKNIFHTQIADGKIKVYYPAFRDITDPDVQTHIRQAMEEAYRFEAKEYLPQRLDYFARKFGFSYNKVFVKNTRTRWGSCSHVNNVNLSLHLMRLPEHLCDYVILHELAHTVEKNHGPRFWALLNQISGDARGLDNELKNFKIAIF